MRKKIKLLFALAWVILLTNFTLAQDSKTISFTVLDENKKFLSDLKITDVRISQNKKTLTVNSLEKNLNRQLDVVLMIDSSASQETVLPLVKQIAQNFIAASLKKNNDRVAVVEFAGAVTVRQALTDDFAVAVKKLNDIEIKFPTGEIIGTVVKGGQRIIITKPSSAEEEDLKKISTSIWDAVKEITQTVLANGQSRSRKVIMLLTDGRNTSGEAKRREAVEAAIEADVPIYAIGIGDKNFGVDEQSLKNVSSETGGLSFTPKLTDDLPMIFKIIENALRSNYELTFTPNSKREKGLIQKMKIEIINPQLAKRKLGVIQSKGYILP